MPSHWAWPIMHINYNVILFIFYDNIIQFQNTFYWIHLPSCFIQYIYLARSQLRSEDLTVSIYSGTFLKTMTSQRESSICQNILHCTKTSKKKGKPPNGDYSLFQRPLKIWLKNYVFFIAAFSIITTWVEKLKFFVQDDSKPFKQWVIRALML